MRRIAYELDPAEVVFRAVRSQGAGGQNVNKVATAIQVVFNIPASTLPEAMKARLQVLYRRRISAAGDLILKAQEHRTQEMNRSAALERLLALIDAAAIIPERRIPTRPTRASVRRRLDNKRHRSQAKQLRRGSFEW